MTTDTATATSYDPAIVTARQVLYRFAALSFLDPKAGTWSELDAIRNDDLLLEAASLIRNLPEAIPSELAFAEHPIADFDPADVLARLPNTSDELNEQYESTFGLLVSNACPPYETEYVDSKLTFQRSNSMADISGFYHAFGMTTSDQLPERPDHIVQELEFMAALLSLERQAYDDTSENRDEHLEVCRDAQRRFLKEHLGWWSPVFCMLLEHEGQGTLYEASAAFLAAFIPVERALLNVEPMSRSTTTPTAIELPEQCNGCLDSD